MLSEDAKKKWKQSLAWSEACILLGDNTCIHKRTKYIHSKKIPKMECIKGSFLLFLAILPQSKDKKSQLSFRLPANGPAYLKSLPKGNRRQGINPAQFRLRTWPQLSTERRG